MIWKDSRLVHVLLLVFAFGHWIVLALGTNQSSGIFVFVLALTHRTLRSDVANLQASDGECLVHVVHPRLNAAIFVYSEPRHCVQTDVFISWYPSPGL